MSEEQDVEEVVCRLKQEEEEEEEEEVEMQDAVPLLHVATLQWQCPLLLLLLHGNELTKIQLQ